MIPKFSRVAIFTFFFLALGALTVVQASAQSTHPQPPYGTAPSVAVTSWHVLENDTEHDEDVMNFMADGTIDYTYQAGHFHNGTWKQDGDTIYFEFNNKYAEYQGHIIGTHMEGNAWNVKGEKWTWTGDKLANFAGPSSIGIASAAGLSGLAPTRPAEKP